MKRTVLVCGLIAGLIVAVLMALNLALYYKSDNYDGSVWIGYGTMLIAFSLIFVGIKNFRDKYNNGLISFGKAFTIGLYITLIASTIYVLVWLVEYYVFIPDFMDKYADHVMQVSKAKGATEMELRKQASQMADYKEMYKNPLWIILFTYAEILPVGLLVTLITALLLKRKIKRTASFA